jgi:hypothetical protein
MITYAQRELLRRFSGGALLTTAQLAELRTARLIRHQGESGNALTPAGVEALRLAERGPRERRQ